MLLPPDEMARLLEEENGQTSKPTGSEINDLLSELNDSNFNASDPVVAHRQAVAASLKWRAPEDADSSAVFDCVDAHCQGLPARVICRASFCEANGKESDDGDQDTNVHAESDGNQNSGNQESHDNGNNPSFSAFYALPTVAQKREYFMANFDHVRETLMLEPRGSPCTNLDFLVPSNSAKSGYGYIVAEQNKIYPLMSGHNTICVCVVLLETGRIPMVGEEDVGGEEVLDVVGNNNGNTNGNPTIGIVNCKNTVYTRVLFDLEAPGGIIEIEAICDRKRKKVKQVQFRNMMSFSAVIGREIKNIPDLGTCIVDIAFGGMWYCIVDVAQFRKRAGVGSVGGKEGDKLEGNGNAGNINKSNSEDTNITYKSDTDDPIDPSLASQFYLRPEHGHILTKYGEMIKVRCQEQCPVRHPTLEGYCGPDILVFQDWEVEGEDVNGSANPKSNEAQNGTNHQNSTISSTNHLTCQNTVIMSTQKLDWEKPETWRAVIDRSPCGSGTSALLANLHAKGLLGENGVLDNYSILMTKFVGKIEEVIENGIVGGEEMEIGVDKKKEKTIPTIIPTVTGTGWITGYHTVVVDPSDPFPRGFKVKDIW